MISIYKLIEEGFEQAFINEGETIPTGWTTEKPNVDFEDSEEEKEKEMLYVAIDELANIISNQAAEIEELKQISLINENSILELAELLGGEE